MVKINLEYQGHLRIKAIHTPSGKELITDAPVDNHGRGESFSPTDLVATATAACMSTLMGIYAEKNAIVLDGMKMSVEKHMIPAPVRRIGKLVIHFQMPKGIVPRYQKALEKAALTCPVKHSLHPDVILDIHFHWE